MKNKQAKYRVVALLLAVALLSGFAVPVFGTAPSAVIAFGQVTGKPGGQVTVPVTVQNNPGIAGFRFWIAYDTDALTYVSAEKAEAMTGGTLTAAYQEETQKLVITWFDVKNVTDDGVLFNLVFEISDDVEGEYPLQIRYLPEDMVNATWQQVDCHITDGCVRLGSNITGTVHSSGDANGKVTLRLLQGDQEVATTVTTSGTYQLPSVPAGDYTLEVSKLNHVTRAYDLSVTDQDVTQDLKIHLIGDIDGSGSVNMGDISIQYAHIRGARELTDEYQLRVANIDGNSLNMGDFSALYAHIKGTKKLY